MATTKDTKTDTTGPSPLQQIVALRDAAMVDNGTLVGGLNAAIAALGGDPTAPTEVPA